MTDATLIALTLRTGEKRIATLDRRHFTVVKEISDATLLPDMDLEIGSLNSIGPLSAELHPMTHEIGRAPHGSFGPRRLRLAPARYDELDIPSPSSIERPHSHTYWLGLLARPAKCSTSSLSPSASSSTPGTRSYNADDRIIVPAADRL